MGVHTLESHLINVNKLCRVCGKREREKINKKNTMTDVKLLKTVNTTENKFCIIMALTLRVTIL